jgi:cytochrome c-type biogenesis protein CcsB
MMNVSLLFNLSFAGYFVALILYIITFVFAKKSLEKAAFLVLILAFVTHAVLISGRWITTGQPPLITLYESLMFYGWCLTLIYLVFSKLYKIRFLGGLLSLILTIIFGALSLLDKTSEPLIPALKSNWLFIHVASYFVAYAAATISFILAIIYLSKLKTGEQNLLDSLDQLSFKFIAVSFPFLTIGLTTGSVWANVAWGSWWSWDPKETWSLITWFVYAAYLHLRLFKGIKGKIAAGINILGFFCIIFTFLGVNYLLPGLHSYT